MIHCLLIILTRDQAVFLIGRAWSQAIIAHFRVPKTLPLKTRLKRLSCAFYPHFRRQLWVRNWKIFSALRASVWSKNKVGAVPPLSERVRTCSGDFWKLLNDAVSGPSSRLRHLSFRTTDWNNLGGYWIKVFRYNGWWQVVRNCESGIYVFHPSWLCNELVMLGTGGFVEGHSVLFS